MRKRTLLQLSLLFILTIIFSNNLFATKFYSNGDGNWTNSNSWNNGGNIPTANDTVYINGHSITINSKISIKRIEITNSAFTSGDASLIIKGTDTLTVSGNVLMTAVNNFKNLDLKVQENATLIVNGNFDMIRTLDNNSASWLSLYLSDDSKTKILGDFSFNYQNSQNFEFGFEVYSSGNAIFDITGMTTLTTSGGKDLNIVADGNSQIILRDSVSLLTYGGSSTGIASNSNSSVDIYGNIYMLNSGGKLPTNLTSGIIGGNLNVHGDLYMESTADKKEVKLIAFGTSPKIRVNGDINMTAVSDSSVNIYIGSSGEMSFGGNINRPTGYGALKMEESAKFIFKGTNAQSIPPSKINSSNNNDSLFFSNLEFSIESGSSIALQNDLIIQDTLFLSKGNIQSSELALLIVEEGAYISGGSDSAYIEGPVLKKGSASETSFLFPIGDSNGYAPMAISNTTLGASEYTATYYSDPPPFGASNASGIINVSETQYWKLDKKSGSQDVDVTLFWEDAQLSGIQDLASLIVVGLNEGANEWESYGNGGTTGGTGSGVSGSIINSLASDPPPFGVINFTLGSTSALNSLPVELTKFHVIQQNSKVGIFWETASERNTSHFEIERSTDGFSFSEIERMKSYGDGIIIQKYSTKDVRPGSGLNYYRLKIVDNDGTFEYSNIEVVNFEATPDFSLFPNPVDNLIQLQRMDHNVEKAILEVFDKNGKRIYKNEISFENGYFQISTDAVNIQYPGTYFLKVTERKRSHLLKFMKIN